MQLIDPRCTFRNMRMLITTTVVVEVTDPDALRQAAAEDIVAAERAQADPNWWTGDQDPSEIIDRIGESDAHAFAMRTMLGYAARDGSEAGCRTLLAEVQVNDETGAGLAYAEFVAPGYERASD